MLVLGITVIFLFLRVVEDKETILTILVMKNILDSTVEACSRYLLTRASSIVHNLQGSNNELFDNIIWLSFTL